MRLVTPSTEDTLAAEQERRLTEVDRRTTATQAAFSQYADPPLFVARQAALQSIPNAVDTEVVWGAVEVDTHGGAKDTGGYTVQVDGVYVVQASVLVFANATTSKKVTNLRLNGTPVRGSSAHTIGGNPNDLVIPTPAIPLACVEGDRISVNVWQNDGAARNTWWNATDPAVPVFVVRWVRTATAVASAGA
jgi:hypothetical protein